MPVKELLSQSCMGKRVEGFVFFGVFGSVREIKLANKRFVSPRTPYYFIVSYRIVSTLVTTIMAAKYLPSSLDCVRQS